MDSVTRVRERIAAACTRAGRDPDSVTLIAVSKRKPAAAVDAVADAGVEVFGESYVQEALTKQDEVSRAVRWHFVGHLQRNKARQVVGKFDLIHSLDSERLARELDKRADGHRVAVLIEVNLAGEASKSGLPLKDLDDLVETVKGLPNLDLRGLMTMPPFSEIPEDSRAYFKQLAVLGSQLGLPELSMGMTNDFEVAIEEGATLVRIGTAIFGART